jgi:hypothetical protein
VIEALIKKARHALSVANEGRADSSSPGFIGKYLSRLRKLDHAIVLKIGFEP